MDNPIKIKIVVLDKLKKFNCLKNFLMLIKFRKKEDIISCIEHTLKVLLSF